MVIERPDTPVPWMNYLHNDEYCALISNNGGGYSLKTTFRREGQEDFAVSP